MIMIVKMHIMINIYKASFFWYFDFLDWNNIHPEFSEQLRVAYEQPTLASLILMNSQFYGNHKNVSL